jgi:hypothetical protein
VTAIPTGQRPPKCVDRGRWDVELFRHA